MKAKLYIWKMHALGFVEIRLMYKKQYRGKKTGNLAKTCKMGGYII